MIHRVTCDARCIIDNFQEAMVFDIPVYRKLGKWACGAPGPSAVSGAAKKQY